MSKRKLFLVIIFVGIVSYLINNLRIEIENNGFIWSKIIVVKYLLLAAISIVLYSISYRK